MRQYIGLFSIILLFCQVPGLAASFGIRPDGKLDKKALSKAYQESEWDDVRKTLETYLRGKDEHSIDVDDRIFAYKHLGVIFASDTNTHTRAESYFNRLFDLSPNIEIVDMFVSKKVSDFFREVKQDYKIEKSYSSNYDELGRRLKPGDARTSKEDAKGRENAPHPPPGQGKPPGYKREGRSWVWWTVGLAAAAGVGASYYYLSQSPGKDSTVTPVTPQ